MRTGILALTALLIAGCSAEPEPLEDLPADEEPDDQPDDEEPAECTAFDGYTCRDGNVHAVDSCGEAHDLIAECSGDSFCETGLSGCCTPTPASGPSLLDQGAYVIGTDVGMSAETSKLSWEIEVIDAPTDDDDEYMMMVFDFNVGDHRMWVAMGTDLNGVAGSPHGFYMTDLESADVAVRLAEPDGYDEINETADYRGIRKPYPWAPGTFVLTLQRGDSTATGHWYELSVLADGDEAPTFLGAIDIPLSGGQPAMIAARHREYMYIYSGAADYADIDRLATRVRPVAEGAEVQSVTTSYEPFEASEARWQDGRLFMSVGQGTVRCTDDGELHAAG
jgi:hypothetical protein